MIETWLYCAALQGVKDFSGNIAVVVKRELWRACSQVGFRNYLNETCSFVSGINKKCLMYMYYTIYVRLCMISG